MAEKKAQGPKARGMYYRAGQTRNQTLYRFEEARDKLPAPLLPRRENWLGCYRCALELAFKNSKAPTPQSGFVSNFVDAAFNQDFFLWDTVFITMFADLLRPWLPGVEALDNFYVKQQPDGEIPREMLRESGEDMPFWVNAQGLPLHSYFHNHYGFRGLFNSAPPPVNEMFFPDLGRPQTMAAAYTLDNLNHPLLAWGEWVSYAQTGNSARLAAVLLPLLRQYDAMQALLRHANGLYVTDWASMDNSPRNAYLGCGADISCEMALFAKNLLDIQHAAEKAGLCEPNKALCRRLEADYAALRGSINALLWDEDTGFYYDLKPDGTRAPVKTVAAYWALAAGVATKEQAARMAAWLQDPATFNRVHRVPVCAADDPGYDPRGGYWRGSVWAPTNTMVLYGLERYGYGALAKEIALNHLDAVAQVWKQTGTIWENYPADSISKGDADHGDFVGWSGIGPVRYLLRYAVGLVPDAPRNRLIWNLDAEMAKSGPVGCERFCFGNVLCDIKAQWENGRLLVTARGGKPFTLCVNCLGRTTELAVENTVQHRL